MQDMEEELRAEGKLDSFSKKAVEQEVDRRTRATATAIPKGNQSSSKSPILTKDEKEMCDRLNIKYDSYLSSKKSLNAERQVEE